MSEGSSVTPGFPTGAGATAGAGSTAGTGSTAGAGATAGAGSTAAAGASARHGGGAHEAGGPAAVRHDSGPATGSGLKQGFAAGTSIAAGILLATVGVLQVLQGIAAIAKDDIIVVGQEYTFSWSVSAWGWVHLILGILVAVIGLALVTGATWARVAAIVIAALSIIANFLWLPYYPGWSLAIIAIDVVVIWAVSTWDADRTWDAGRTEPGYRP